MDKKSTALVIIDMQNDFVHDEGFSKKNAPPDEHGNNPLDVLKEPIPHISSLAAFFRDNNMPVIHIYTACEADYSDVALPRKVMTKAKEMGALVKGTWGANIIDELAPHPTDHMVRKTSYGGFFQTPLDRTLRNMQVTDLIITGVNTNYCVETTVREAVAYGYEVTLVSDATKSFDLQGHEATLKVIAAGFGEVMSTREVLQHIAA